MPSKEYKILDDPKYTEFEKWSTENGIWHPKLEYPCLFGSGKTSYIGTIASEDVGKHEVIVKVPSKCIITAYNGYSDPLLKLIIYEHPEVFARNHPEGEDNIICAFLFLELLKGKDSFWHPWFLILPKEKDLLFKWSEEELELLLDNSLVELTYIQLDLVMDSWLALYNVLKLYPDVFEPDIIGLSNFLWIWSILTSRCFNNAWNLSSFVPWADLLNHENVDSSYDVYVTGNMDYESELKLS